ncbi:MAG: HAD family hydrolase [Sphaerochaeta sp.]|jgi:phosphoserine phosphatase|uniref:HAD family hydrolase n=1 Tax=Sphaerochaeta sp. TaxID=1972642 RepID=UPI002FC69686
MNSRALIAFDFDGTLYPIKRYDSEQRLIRKHAATKGTLFQMRCKRFIKQDQEGKLGASFHQRYARLLTTVDRKMIEQVAGDLIGSLAEEDVKALVSLSAVADLMVLTCGTENLVEAFLRQLGIEQCFCAVRGKRLMWDKQGRASLLVDIADPQGKASALKALSGSYHPIIAIGDGPTDLPMLAQADLGLILAWDTQTKHYPYETHSSLAEACKRSMAYLLSV